jgi:hypothetical protein
LRAHPGIEVICRDRAGAYAEAARLGATTAVQVADRWHLWHNLAGHLERTVLAHRGCLREAVDPDQGERSANDPVRRTDETADTSGGEVIAPVRELAILTRTRQRYAAISRLSERGESISAVPARWDWTSTIGSPITSPGPWTRYVSIQVTICGPRLGNSPG